MKKVAEKDASNEEKENEAVEGDMQKQQEKPGGESADAPAEGEMGKKDEKAAGAGANAPAEEPVGGSGEAKKKKMVLLALAQLTMSDLALIFLLLLQKLPTGHVQSSIFTPFSLAKPTRSHSSFDWQAEVESPSSEQKVEVKEASSTSSSPTRTHMDFSFVWVAVVGA